MSLKLHFAEAGFHKLKLWSRRVRRMEGDSVHMAITHVHKDMGHGGEPMSQNSIFLIPLCLFCENSAAFKTFSDSPENSGGVFFVF